MSNRSSLARCGMGGGLKKLREMLASLRALLDNYKYLALLDNYKYLAVLSTPPKPTT